VDDGVHSSGTSGGCRGGGGGLTADAPDPTRQHSTRHNFAIRERPDECAVRAEASRTWRRAEIVELHHDRKMRRPERHGVARTPRVMEGTLPSIQVRLPEWSTQPGGNSSARSARRSRLRTTRWTLRSPRRPPRVRRVAPERVRRSSGSSTCCRRGPARVIVGVTDNEVSTLPPAGSRGAPRSAPRSPRGVGRRGPLGRVDPGGARGGAR